MKKQREGNGGGLALRHRENEILIKIDDGSYWEQTIAQPFKLARTSSVKLVISRECDLSFFQLRLNPCCDSIAHAEAVYINIIACATAYVEVEASYMHFVK